MASNDVNIKIVIGASTYEVKAARKDVNELGRSLSNTDTIANALSSSFGRMAVALGVFTGAAIKIKDIAKSGIEANRVFENLKIQLAGLIAANSSNISSLGNTINAQQKWSFGLKESEKILRELNATNQRTKFSLAEIVESFNMFYATSANQSDRNKAVVAMDSIALAAQAVGKDLKALAPMMDSLAAGTVVSASEMGSFMKIVGLTNEELKKANESGKLYDYLIEKLANFKELSDEAAKSYEVALGGFKNELSDISKELSKPMFDHITTALSGFTKFIKENREWLSKYFGYITDGIEVLTKLSLAFGAVKFSAFAFGGISIVVSGFKTVFTNSIMASLVATTALNKGLIALNMAFKTFLPTALVFGGFELLMHYFNKSADGADNLAESIRKTTEEFKKLTEAKRELLKIDLESELKSLGKQVKDKQFYIETVEKELNQLIKISPKMGGIDGRKERLARARVELEDLKSKYIEASGALHRLNEANYELATANKSVITTIDESIQSFQEWQKNAEQLTKGITTLSGLKKELSEVQKAIQEQSSPLQNAAYEKKRLEAIEALKIKELKLEEQIANFKERNSKFSADYYSAVREMSRALMSDYEKDIDEIKTQTKTWIEAGASVKEALEIEKRLIDKRDRLEADNILKAFAEEKQKAKDVAIKSINEELKLADRRFNLKKRQAELTKDEISKSMQLIALEYEHTQAQYEALLKKGEITKEYYDQAMRLEKKLYERQIFDASRWGRIMHSGLNSLETAMGSFFDYSSDRFMKFGDLANDILSGIAREMTKMMIIQPFVGVLSEGIGGLFSGGGKVHSRGAMTLQNAQGNVFSSKGLHEYVNSIVSKPTFFEFASGGVPSLGVMGEKNGGSPEAIMPLTRMSNGDLGVKSSGVNNVKIEVINQTREDAQVTNVSSRQNMGEQVISIVIDAVRTNKMGMRDILGGGR